MSVLPCTGIGAIICCATPHQTTAQIAVAAAELRPPSLPRCLHVRRHLGCSLGWFNVPLIAADAPNEIRFSPKDETCICRWSAYGAYQKLVWREVERWGGPLESSTHTPHNLIHRVPASLAMDPCSCCCVPAFCFALCYMLYLNYLT